MPNHVMNRISLECSDERAKEIMNAVMFDSDPDDEENTGFGTLDFNKLIPMPPSLMIEAGSSTEQGIEIYLTAVNPHTKDYDYSKMPEEKFNKLVSSLNAERRFTVYKPSLSDEDGPGMARAFRYKYDEQYLFSPGRREQTRISGYHKRGAVVVKRIA